MQQDPLFEQIVRAEALFMQYYNQHDAPGLASMYTEDSQIMPPNEAIVVGRANREALFKSFWDGGFTEMKLTTVEVDGVGDVAYEVGRYVLSDDQHQVKDQGNYIVIWKKQEQWLLHRDIFTASPAA